MKINICYNARHILLFFCAILVLIFQAQAVSACFCLDVNTAEEEFKTWANVAIFKLSLVDRSGPPARYYQVDGIRRAKLTVEKVFKGDLKPGQELTFTQGGGGDCIWTFKDGEIGTEYLFYLSGWPDKDGEWTGPICSHSNRVKDAAAELLYLENLVRVRGKTRIYGRYLIDTGAAGRSNFEPLAGKRVRIFGNGRDITVRTDGSGVYEIYDLPPGKYKVVPEKQDGYRFSYDPAETYSTAELKAGAHARCDFDFMKK